MRKFLSAVVLTVAFMPLMGAHATGEMVPKDCESLVAHIKKPTVTSGSGNSAIREDALVPAASSSAD